MADDVKDPTKDPVMAGLLGISTQLGVVQGTVDGLKGQMAETRLWLQAHEKNDESRLREFDVRFRAAQLSSESTQKTRLLTEADAERALRKRALLNTEKAATERTKFRRETIRTVALLVLGACVTFVSAWAAAHAGIPVPPAEPAPHVAPETQRP